jgi:hypothetical protein
MFMYFSRCVSGHFLVSCLHLHSKAYELLFLHFQESVAGAKKFMFGVGRHGKFYNLSDRKETEPVRSNM